MYLRMELLLQLICVLVFSINMPLKSVWSWKDFVTEQTFVGFARIVLHYEVFFHRVLMGKCFLTLRTLNICSFCSILTVNGFAMLDQHFGSFAHFTASGTLVHVLNARVLRPTAAGGEYFVADQAFISSVVNVRCIAVMFTFVGVQGTRQKKPFFAYLTLIGFLPSVGSDVLRQGTLLCESC